MKEKYFFKSNKIKYPEFLKTVEEMLKQKILFCDKNTIARGIDALSNLHDITSIIQNGFKISDYDD